MIGEVGGGRRPFDVRGVAALRNHPGAVPGADPKDFRRFFGRGGSYDRQRPPLTASAPVERCFTNAVGIGDEGGGSAKFAEEVVGHGGKSFSGGVKGRGTEALSSIGRNDARTRSPTTTEKKRNRTDEDRQRAAGESTKKNAPGRSRVRFFVSCVGSFARREGATRRSYLSASKTRAVIASIEPRPEIERYCGAPSRPDLASSP